MSKRLRGRRIGAVRLEAIDVTSEQHDLIRRRTEWIARDFITFDRSFRHALDNAYIAGMNDALNAESKE